MSRRALTTALLLASCAHYQPAPIDPSAAAPSFYARRLDAPPLLAWLKEQGTAPVGARWSAGALAIVALYYRPELDALRARWRAARQGERSATTRPAPGVQTEVERAVSGTRDNAPWVVAVSAPLTLELGGKRGGRMALARARAAGAEQSLRAAAWQIALSVRLQLDAVVAAEQAVAQADRQAAAATALVDLVARRFAEGTLPATEPLRARGEAQTSLVTAANARRAASAARATLARMVGLPLAELRSLALDADGADGCAWADSLSADSLAEVGVRQRSEVGAALTSYAEAEAELRLQVAAQYPDLTIAPGFIWDQGMHRWTLGAGLPGILLQKNRGPIAEARERRTAAAADVAAAQSTVLGELESVREGCRVVDADVPALDSLSTSVGRARDATRAAYQRGETGQLEVAQAELAVVRAEGARLEAARRRRATALALEAAAGVWRADPPLRWPDPRTDPPRELRESP